jgi:hypothetical protein
MTGQAALVAGRPVTVQNSYSTISDRGPQHHRSTAPPVLFPGSASRSPLVVSTQYSLSFSMTGRFPVS